MAAVNILLAIQVSRFMVTSKKDRAYGLLRWLQLEGWNYDAPTDLYTREWTDSGGDHIEAMKMDDLVDRFLERRICDPSLTEILKRDF